MSKTGYRRERFVKRVTELISVLDVVVLRGMTAFLMVDLVIRFLRTEVASVWTMLWGR